MKTVEKRIHHHYLIARILPLTKQIKINKPSLPLIKSDEMLLKEDTSVHAYFKIMEKLVQQGRMVKPCFLFGLAKKQKGAAIFFLLNLIKSNKKVEKLQVCFSL